MLNSLNLLSSYIQKISNIWREDIVHWSTWNKIVSIKKVFFFFFGRGCYKRNMLLMEPNSICAHDHLEFSWHFLCNLSRNRNIFVYFCEFRWLTHKWRNESLILYLRPHTGWKSFILFVWKDGLAGGQVIHLTSIPSIILEPSCKSVLKMSFWICPKNGSILKSIWHSWLVKFWKN